MRPEGEAAGDGSSVVFSLAPMEGITGHVFRRAFFESFQGVGRCYSPFLSPRRGEIGLTGRGREEVRPENNEGIPLIPQLLCNRAEDFLAAAGELYSLGYRELNLNLGCPSGTVAAKKKGAGFLSEPELLREFFDRVFEKLKPGMRLSVKTRIGSGSPEEFPELLELFNAYPISELTIHPRTQKEFYRGEVHLEVFAYAAERALMPLCYNGDLVDGRDIRKIRERFPGVRSIMLGRGLLRDPFLAERFQGQGRNAGEESARSALLRFHEKLLNGYLADFGFENAALCRMKEFWSYFSFSFGEECARELKKLKKSRTLEEYLPHAERILRAGRLAAAAPRASTGAR